MSERLPVLNCDKGECNSEYDRDEHVTFKTQIISKRRNFMSASIEIARIKRRPRAVVVLLGWLGAQKRFLDKYATLWQERDCTTINVIVPVWITMSGLCGYSVTEDIMREIDKIGRAAEMTEAGWGRLPVILHVFSNGGAFVVENMERFLRNKREININNNCPESRSDRQMRHICESMSARLWSGCTIYDSSPCYPSYASGVIAVGRAVSVPVFNVLFQSLFALYVICIDFLPYYIQRNVLRNNQYSAHAEKFWKCMEQNCLTRNEVYVYSTSDDLADSDYLDKLVQRKTTNKIVNILQVLRFTDSEHVSHLRVHPFQYQCMIDNVLNTVASVEAHIHPESDDDAWSI